MALAWDYSSLALTYDKRPGYAPGAWDEVAARARLEGGDAVADIGAGTGKLTRLLLERGYCVTAVEPDDSMMWHGMRNTEGQALNWVRATAESTGLASASFKAVAFGSSFNVVDRPCALAETARILKPGGWLVCMWNHRRLDDGLQAEIEEVIRRIVPDFDYGVRRTDQEPAIRESGRFGNIGLVEATFTHTFAVSDFLDAWRSHATLVRQAAGRFERVMEGIKRVVADRSVLEVPYTTRAWYARLRQGMP